MSRVATFVFGMVTYVSFFAVLIFAVGFISGSLTPLMLLSRVWRAKPGRSN